MNTRAEVNRYPWIVMRDMPGELLCTRCGESYKPTLPCLFDVYIAICKAFTRSHRRCNDARLPQLAGG